MEVATMQDRRGSLTLADCDRELKILVGRLASARRRGDKFAVERWLLDIDQWLDRRSKITAAQVRMRAQGPRGL